MADQAGSSASERGIPAMPFIEDIDAFMDKEGRSPETALQKLQEQYQGYKQMEQRLTARKVKLKMKLPDIDKTLGVVTRMKRAQEEGESVMRTHYELCDAVYAKANVPLTSGQTVFLWLGAGVMVEYSVEEAIDLLKTNLTNAEKALAEVVADFAFLKDQMTTSEVNIARVYNWDVRERRKKEGSSGGRSSSK